ncbi:MAG: patatin-like phospholipase family protein [Acidobacteriota bacterium]|jgi:NTE family protein
MIRPSRLLLLLALLAPGPSAARPPAVQEPGAAVAERPRIGLVLSGGGARGAAHVGVLKVLEELHVPVDAVACTSMGAVVGGLYATGHGPGELQEILLQADWEELFRDRPPRDEMPFRRKQDDRDILFRFELGVGRSGVSLPSGLVASQKLSFLLRSLTLDAADIQDFDDLPIPFRAVATDLNDGRPVVLADGDLVSAIRASIAIPGLLGPVEIGGRILVDGGLVANLPVDVARAMGVDRIIAVDAGTPPDFFEKVPSALEVSAQAFMVVSERFVEEQREMLGPDDLLITPELGEISSTKFSRTPEILERGEKAARALEDRLRDFSVSPEAYEAYRAARASRGSHGPVRLDRIEVEGLDRVDPRRVTRQIHSRTGQPLDLETLQQDLARVYRIGAFENVDFRVVREGPGTVLVIRATEKSWGPGYLRFGTGLEADFSGSGEYVLIGHYRRELINRLGAEWRNVLRLGSLNDLRSDFFQPLDFSGRWFVNPILDLQRVEEDRFLPSGARERLLLQSWDGELDVGIQIGNRIDIRGGYLGGQLFTEILSESDPAERHDLGAAVFQFTLDVQDNVWFPHRGAFTKLRVESYRRSLGATDRYDKAFLEASQPWSSGRDTVTLAARLGSSLGSDLPFYAEFTLGGFLGLSGLERNALQGDALGLLSLLYYRRIASLGPLGDALYVGAAVQAGNVWPTSSDVDASELLLSGTVFFGAETIVGPVYVGWGLTEGGSSSAYVFLGRLF